MNVSMPINAAKANFETPNRHILGEMTAMVLAVAYAEIFQKCMPAI
jgi:hypothetical protein